MWTMCLITVMVSQTGEGRIDAPSLSDWPHDLAAPVVTDEGTLIPPDRAAALDHRLAECDQMQPRCQARLDAQVAVMMAEIKAERHRTMLECVNGQGWQTWEVFGVALGGVVTGAIIGAIAVSF